MLTIAIQAGGQSRRMGRDKGLVPLAGLPLIEHLLSRVTGLGDEILITTNQPKDYAYLNLPMAGDETPGAGALEGLYTALQAARGDHVLVLACDMPFVNIELLKHLISLAPAADVVVPLWQDVHQTLHAVYARDACLPAVQASLQENKKRMISFYDLLAVRVLQEEEVARFDPEGLSFFNVNTPEEVELAERILAQMT